MKKVFEGDRYLTPSNKRRYLKDRIFLNTRFYFVIHYIWLIFQFRLQVLFKKYDNAAWVKSSYRIMKLLEGCGAKFEIEGLDNLKKIKKPVVFISNHMSALETQILPVIVQPYLDVTFVVKEALLKAPLFGPILKTRNPVAVKRVNPRDDLKVVLEEGAKILKKGISIIIFPQSTRSVDFKSEEFNSLGIKLALKAGVNAVPIALKTNFWQNGKKIKDFGPLKRDEAVHFSIGDEIPVDGRGKEQHFKVVEYIKKKLNEWL